MLLAKPRPTPPSKQMEAFLLTAAEEAAMQAWLKGVVRITEAKLDELTPPVGSGQPEERLWACMRYGVLVGGKRFRPALMAAGYEAVTGNPDVPEDHGLWRAAAAMEMIHTYSLMQDDLPSMDNDDLRRGQPTAHKKFDEMTALLASDGLLTDAFAVLSDPQTHLDGNVRARLVSLAAVGAGSRGMVAGQMVDMLFEDSRETRTVADLARLQTLKTGALIKASVTMGAVMGGADEHLLSKLGWYAEAVGLAFQIWDDVLDATGSAAQLGKTPGKDAKAGKVTYVSLLGLEGASQAALDQVRTALGEVDHFCGESCEPLRWLAKYAVTRTR